MPTGVSIRSRRARGSVSRPERSTRVALTWNNRVSLVLTDALQVKRVSFLDVVFEANSAQGKDDGFDADVAIATAELSQLIPDLFDALDGEVVEG